MFNSPMFLISLAGIVIGVITFGIISFTQKYIQNEGQKSGLTNEEINKWQTKALLYGGIFGIYLFKKELKRRADNNK